MSTEPNKTNFIRNIIDADLASGKHQTIVTRFPPEPSGYLHIGHAKPICLNFGIAADYPNAYCYLRFDDTNPVKEEAEYSQAMQEDINWLGFDWGEHLTHASDYYEEFYQAAIRLIKAGKAYVCSLSADEVRAYRGTLTEPGKNSPDRERGIAENLALFERMRAGEFANGTYSLRAKIDMSSGNINLRDPAIYRIRKHSHPRTGDKWCIYPMYDFAHALNDALEGITHSLCTLEFQDHRPLYDWVVENCEMSHTPHQIEFSRLNFTYTITSKRKLRSLIDAGVVSGWDDPRMSTIRGIRRRGYPAAAIREMCRQVGISKQDSVIDISVLENCVRNELNQTAERRMGVLRPIKVVITNYPEDEFETLQTSNHPQKPELGRRDIKFGRELYIEQDDFCMDPPAKYFRLAPGREARLLNAYIIRCDEVITADDASVLELHCTYLPETLAGKKPAHGGKVKGVIHWLSAQHCLSAEVRMYGQLFKSENPAIADDIIAELNPDSLAVLTEAKVEPCLANVAAENVFQFNRLGYFCADRVDYNSSNLVFNQVVSLREGSK